MKYLQKEVTVVLNQRDIQNIEAVCNFTMKKLWGDYHEKYRTHHYLTLPRIEKERLEHKKLLDSNQEIFDKLITKLKRASAQV